VRAEIVTVGTELLLGPTPNSNAQTIIRALAGIGVEAHFQTTVDDDVSRIAECISVALNRNDVVIVTGGLGPTHDDLTRQALATATGRSLEHREDLEHSIRRWFQSRGRQMAESNLSQAMMPQGGEAISNKRGTAPGIELKLEHGWLFALPGVPNEMELMLNEHIVPKLSSYAGGEPTLFRYVNVAGIGESDLASRIRDIVNACEREGQPAITLVTSTGADINIQLSARAKDRATATKIIQVVESRLREVLGDLVYGVDDETLEEVVSNMAVERGLTIGLAESFTGGALVSRIVAVPGASKFLKAGYVTYSPDRKVADIDVPEETLKRYGAVSEQTARAMAEGVRRRSEADIGLSTTGEAGPEPEEEPVGTMFIGLSWEGGSKVAKLAASGGRQQVRLAGCQQALNLLRLWMIGSEGV
jgi:nicotinamide-nucleotide amidase